MTAAKKRGSRNLTSKVLVLFAVIVALESGFLLLLSLLLDDSEKRLAEERHARAVVAAIAKFSTTQQSAGLAVLNQTRYKTVMLDEYKETFKRLPRDLEELKALFKDRPEDLERLKELDNQMDDALDLFAKVIATSRDKDTAEKKMLYHHYCIQLIDLSGNFSTQVDEIMARYKEIEVSASLSAAALSDNLVNVCLVLGFLINAGVAIALYLFVVRGITNRLNVVAANTVNIALGKPLLEPVKGHDEVAGLDSTFRDMARSLKEIQTKEKTILEHAANFICLLDREGAFVSVPAACSAMWGFSEDDFVGSRFQSIVTADYIDDTTEALESLALSGGSTSFENQIRCQDGSLMDLSWTATLNNEGNIVCVAHDITERKRITGLIQSSEERFSTIIESMPIAVIGCDRSFVIESLNSPTTSMFLYQLNELLGKSLDVLLTNPSSARQTKVSDDMKEIMEIALNRTTQLNVWRRDGGQLPVELNLNAYTAPQGERLLACFRDISARVELELAKRDFVSMIGHDLRSPLMSLYGTLGMIAEEKSGSVFSEAERIIENLVLLINDFLELGKIEAATDALALSEIKLSELLGQVKSTNVDLQLDFDPTLRVDPERLVRSLDCLIETMRYFNSDGEVVSISTARSEANVVLTVTGGSQCSLPQVVKESCIEGYAFVETGGSAESSGLRLALTRAVLAAHRGALAVREIGGNQVFEIRVPIS